jgi:uncharacterized membrane protein HdeD (DUF308 family)
VPEEAGIVDSRNDVTADRTGSAVEEAARRRRRVWNLVLGIAVSIGAVLALTAPEVTPNSVGTAVICGACALLAFVAAARGR